MNKTITLALILMAGIAIGADDNLATELAEGTEGMSKLIWTLVGFAVMFIPNVINNLIETKETDGPTTKRIKKVIRILAGSISKKSLKE